MQRTLLPLLLGGAVILAGCNTWQGAKQDAKDAGSAVTNAVGTGLQKTGQGLNKAGNNVKSAGSDDDSKAPPQQQSQ